MKHRPDMKLLRRYLEASPEGKKSLSEYMAVGENCIEVWLCNGKLPKTKRRFILNYLNEQLGGK